MANWEPWRGCRRVSEGCRHCYIHKGDAKRGVDTGAVVRTERFHAPVERKKDGAYRMKPGQTVFVCFASDFLIEDADAWRPECWAMMAARPDLHFLFLTKRIARLAECLPPDWGAGYDNVTVGCTVEDQAAADARLPVFLGLPIRHRNIVCQPMLGPMDISKYLDGAELVVAGGESDREARPLDYAWVLDLRAQCLERGAGFQFRQCGSRFLKDGKEYRLGPAQMSAQARKAGIDLPPGNAGR
ncbi:MAG TPA: DUF5131 family protein [Candidatus Limnocylindria bacterium]|nr:DUF5131 family protein [Candidatus Limnocylindria bacterium]